MTITKRTLKLSLAKRRKDCNFEEILLRSLAQQNLSDEELNKKARAVEKLIEHYRYQKKRRPHIKQCTLVQNYKTSKSAPSF